MSDTVSMVAKHLKFLRASATKLASYIGYAYEIIIEKGTYRPHVMDGTNAGGIPLALKSDVDTLESNAVKTTAQTLSETQQTQALENLGVIDALEELITENGGTVPTSLSTNSVQTMSEAPADPWADLV